MPPTRGETVANGWAFPYRPCNVCTRGVSQTLTRAAGWAGSAPILHFVNLRKTEAEREQLVLLADGPRAGKAEALAQPQHRFEALDRTPRRVEGLEAADPRHGPLHLEVIALDALLQVLTDVVDGIAR